ncbi:MAG: dockerin type I repeat-containing protein [Planctomycetes bacterium]|nr:dockerin type I repeat-containing protein [Planctomycetota bacterium]
MMMRFVLSLVVCLTVLDHAAGQATCTIGSTTWVNGSCYKITTENTDNNTCLTTTWAVSVAPAGGGGCIVTLTKKGTERKDKDTDQTHESTASSPAVEVVCETFDDPSSPGSGLVLPGFSFVETLVDPLDPVDSIVLGFAISGGDFAIDAGLDGTGTLYDFVVTVDGSVELSESSFPAVAQLVGPLLRRGDANGDGDFDIADAVFTLSALFVAGSTPPGCEDAADSNDDGNVDIADAVFTLSALFVVGAPPPPPPHPDCGEDPSADSLECALPSSVCAVP